jgi:peptidoglycan/LPS O-acetylase OafA/YrhL
VMPPDLDAFFGPLAVRGYIGVRIFFVVSGFLITYLLLREGRNSGAVDLKAFYLRRVLRIFPVYFLYLAVLGALQAANLHHESASNWFGSLTFTRNFMGNGGSATDHLWTLAVEEQFYLVWPLVFAGLQLFRRPRLACALLIGVLVMSFVMRAIECNSPGWVCQRVFSYASTPMFADSLAAGCLGAYLLTWKGPVLSPKSAGWIVLATLPLIAVIEFWPTETNLGYSARMSAHALLIATAIYCSVIARDTLAFWALNNRPMIFIGVISYSLYIWHPLFLNEIMQLPGVERWLIFDWKVWWAFAMLLAVGSYYYYELRFLRLKDRFVRTKPAPAAVPSPVAAQ